MHLRVIDKTVNIKIKSEWLPVRDGLFYNSNNFQHEYHPATNSLVHTNQFTCSVKDNNSDKSEGNNNSKVPNEDTLENTAAILLKELTGIFVKSHEYQIYRSDIVFENRIKDKVSLILVLMYIRDVVCYRIAVLLPI